MLHNLFDTKYIDYHCVDANINEEDVNVLNTVDKEADTYEGCNETDAGEAASEDLLCTQTICTVSINAPYLQTYIVLEDINTLSSNNCAWFPFRKKESW